MIGLSLPVFMIDTAAPSRRRLETEELLRVAPGSVDSLVEWFRQRLRPVDGLELYWGEATEAGLSASAMVGPFDPGHDRQAHLVAGVPALLVQHVVVHQGE